MFLSNSRSHPTIKRGIPDEPIPQKRHRHLQTSHDPCITFTNTVQGTHDTNFDSNVPTAFHIKHWKWNLNKHKTLKTGRCLRGYVSVWLRVCIVTCLRGYVSVWLRVCVATCLRGYVSAWLCVCVATCLHSYVSVWLHVCMAMCLHSYVSAWLRVCVATCLRGYASVWLRVCIVTCLRGYVSVWLRVCMVTCLRGYVSAWLHAATCLFCKQKWNPGPIWLVSFPTPPVSPLNIRPLTMWHGQSEHPFTPDGKDVKR